MVRHGLIIFESLGEGRVGVETQPFLQQTQTNYLPVVHFGRRFSFRNKLAFVIDDACMLERVVQYTVSGNNKVFKIVRTITGLALPPLGCLPVYGFTVAVEVPIIADRETGATH